MRRAQLMRGTIGSAKRDGNVKLSTRHGVHIRRVVHDLIERHKREAERHEFYDWSQPDHRRSDSQPRKSVLADRCVNDSPRPKSLQETLAHLIRALIFGDLFAHEKNIGIALKFFGERFVQCLAICNFSHGAYV